jgi:hypothetical protein
MDTEDTHSRYLRHMNHFTRWFDVAVKEATRLNPSASTPLPSTIPRDEETGLRALVAILRECIAWYESHEDKSRNMGTGQLGVMLTVFARALSVLTSEGDGDAEGTAPSHLAPTRHQFSDEISPDTEAAITVYCYLKDLTGIRLLACQAWKGYKARTVSLQTASLVANAALAKIRTLSTDLCRAFPRLRNEEDDYMHGNLVTFLHKRGLSFDQQDAPVGLDNSRDLTDDFQTMIVSDVVCFRMARSLANIFPNDTESATRSLVDGVLPDDSTPTPIALTDAENYLFRCLAQLEGLPAEGFWTNDYTWQASVALIDDGYCDTWIVFAAQMLWDAQCVLGDDAQRAVATLEKVTEDMKDCVLDLETSNTQQENARVSLVDRIRETSPLRPFAQTIEKGFSGTYCIDKKDKRFDLLATHPAMCGLKLAELDLEFHKLCVKIASDAGHVLAVAHLYMALDLPVQWSAMNFVIAAQGKKQIFGDAPRLDLEDSIESACKALGVKSGKSRKKRAQANGTPRALQYMSRRSEVSVRPVPSGGTAGQSVLLMLLLIADDFNKHATPSTRSSSILDSFFQVIKNDEAALDLDVLGLHKTCANLLRDIQQTHDLKMGLNDVVVEVLRQMLGKGDRSGTLAGYAKEALRKVIAEANEKQERAEAGKKQEQEEAKERLDGEGREELVEDVGKERNEEGAE